MIARLTLSDDSAFHALGYYRGVLGVPPSSLKPRPRPGFLSSTPCRVHVHGVALDGRRFLWRALARLTRAGLPAPARSDTGAWRRGRGIFLDPHADVNWKTEKHGGTTAARPLPLCHRVAD